MGREVGRAWPQLGMCRHKREKSCFLHLPPGTGDSGLVERRLEPAQNKLSHPVHPSQAPNPAGGETPLPRWVLPGSRQPSALQKSHRRCRLTVSPFSSH